MENLAINSNEPSQTGKDKVTEAFQEISRFFHPGDLDYYRVDLWHWLKAVTCEKPFSFRGEPSTVVTLQKQLTKMILASRMMLDLAKTFGEDLSCDIFPPFSEEQIANDRQYMREIKELTAKYGGTIRRLTLSEADRPILAIRRFFNAHSLEEWSEILDEWVEYGLSKMSICEATGECAQVFQYELLEALLEAFSLILKTKQNV
ncbi:hypothetical protein [Dyadobacter sp. OTU695]|uniref:hypothetical protein n=1 Tax=Dyadobacter sp. OTU695 TaxID=3043860 RepID=UPI00313CE97F